MSTVASLAEQSAAKTFLRLIGAPTTSPQLLLAVVAWMRVTGKTWDARLEAQRILTSSVYTAPPLPDWAKNPEYRDEWTAYLRQLQDQATAFKLVINAARNGLAVDFLVALAETNLDPLHFGVKTNYSDPRENRLLATYSTFTGLALPVQPPAAPPKAPPIPKAPTILLPPVLRPNYIDGWAVKRFYEARHSRSLQSLDGDR